MSGTPWSVKGIDAKAREVAKELAHRSGMTLGEWLNQMILKGEDVDAAIRRERQRTARSTAPRTRRASEPVYAEDDFEEDVYELRDPAPQAAPPRRPAPYSMAAERQRRAPVAPAYYDDGAPAQGLGGDIGKVTRVLETLGSRIENSEMRSASAVRGVSQAVEALLNRLERSESALADTVAETEARMSDKAREVLDTVADSREWLARGEADRSALSERLETAERLVDAQAERLEGLSGHLREERERVARLESELKANPPQAAFENVEAAVGRLANQLYENDVRSRDALKDVRGDLVGLSHRLSQLELRDPDAAAQAAVDRVATQLSQRLEAAEARTATAMRGLERAFMALDERLNRAEAQGDVTDPDSVHSLGRLTADLTRRVEESRYEVIRLLEDSQQKSAEDTLAAVEARLAAAESRQARAIETLGQDVLKIADNLNRKVAAVQRSGNDAVAHVAADMKRLSDRVDARFEEADTTHARALERLSGEIARISESLTRKIVETEKRTAQALEGVGEEMDTRHQRVHSDIAERIRQSEERTQKLLEEARSKIDSRLGQAQTQSLLREAKLEAPQAPIYAPTELQQKPFSAFEHGFDDEVAQTPVAPAKAPETAIRAEVVRDITDSDITGRLLEPVTQFGADPFEDDPFTDLVEPARPADSDPFAEALIAETLAQDALTEDDGLAMQAPLKSRAERQTAPMVDPFTDEFDLDPFAEVEASRKVAPATLTDVPAYEDATPLSTRDALAAARAAVRASIEGADTRKPLGLKLGVSRTRDALPKTEKGKGKTLLNAFKASSIAVVVTAGAVGGYYAFREKEAPAPQKPVLAATAVASPAAKPLTTQDMGRLKAMYDSAALALKSNDPKAVDAMRTVADLGYPAAQYEMSVLYDEGRDGLVVTDKAQARRWAERAAQGGHPSAMYNFGLMNYNGQGGPVDYNAAASWLRKSAEYGVRDGQFGIGVMYMQGTAIPENAPEAYKWLSIAARNGDREAESMLKDLRGRLKPEQLAAAQAAAQAYTPLKPKTDDTSLATR
jgi:localization factor PodJL